MHLCDYINLKEKELKEEFREAKYVKAIDVQLVKNSCSESFLAKSTHMLKLVNEVDLSELEDVSSVRHEPNGTKVSFDVKPPRKRKFVRKVLLCALGN